MEKETKTTSARRKSIGGKTPPMPVTGDEDMTISRKIGGIEFDVTVEMANEILFEEADLVSLGDPNTDAIKNFLYQSVGEYAPISVTWELTNICNFQCGFCYINCTHPQPPVNDLAFYQKVIDDLVEEGMLFCTLTGGECLTHPLFKQIYQMLKERGVLVSVFTNASLLDESHFELFNELPPYKVEVTIYGLREEQFTNVTKASVKLKDCVLCNIERMKEMGIRVVCKTPLNALTQNDYQEIKQWCSSHSIPFYSSPELLDTYTGQSTMRYALREGLWSENNDKRYERLLQKTKKVFGYRKSFDCSGGKYAAVISYNHMLQPCFSAHGLCDFSIPIDRGIKHAVSEWRNRLQKWRETPIPGCQGCEFADVCTNCLLDTVRTATFDRQACLMFQSKLRSIV